MRPNLIQIEPKPTGVKEGDLPTDVPVNAGTITVLKFGQEDGSGYIMFDTSQLPMGTRIRGEVLGYTEIGAKKTGGKTSNTEEVPTTTTSGHNSLAIRGVTQGPGSAFSVNQSGGVTAGTYVSDKFPRPGVVPTVTMCATDDSSAKNSTKKFITIKTDTPITSPYWWFAFDGAVSDSSIEMVDIKEPYGSTHGAPSAEQSASVHIPIDQLIGVQITEIGNPFGGPWRPLNPQDKIRVTITSAKPVQITHVEPGSQREHLDERIVFNCDK